MLFKKMSAKNIHLNRVKLFSDMFHTGFRVIQKMGRKQAKSFQNSMYYRKLITVSTGSNA